MFFHKNKALHALAVQIYLLQKVHCMREGLLWFLLLYKTLVSPFYNAFLILLI